MSVRTIVTGRVVADAEKKLTTSGREMLSFRFAADNIMDKDEHGKFKTYWYRITSWNHLHMAKYITKGKPLMIIGNYNDHLYENKQGYCDISRDIIADTIDFLSTGESNNSNNSNNLKIAKTGSVQGVTTTVEDNIPHVTAASVSKDNITAVLPTDMSEDDELPF